MPDRESVGRLREWVRRLASGLVDRLCGARSDDDAWRRMARAQFGALAGGVAVLAAFIFLVDPYSVVPFSLPLKRALTDTNQRFLYPSIVRSGRYDSLVIGSSTSRLLSPNELNGAFGGHFANLGMSAATAWEETQLARLFLRTVGPPKTIVVAVDAFNWCAPDAATRRVTHRGFPVWMYEDNRWNGLLYHFNEKTLENAGKLAAYWLGFGRVRLGEDGYWDFAPADRQYDLAKARRLIWPDGPSRRDPVSPPVVLSDAQRDALVFPALEWMDSYMADIEGRSRIFVAVMPQHVAGQPLIGSAEAAVDQECFSRVARIAQRHGGVFVDWRIRSSVTTEDANYWDQVHYRLPIASRIVQSLVKAAETKKDAVDGTYIVNKAAL